ncbi:hypothetical protein [Paenibacillus sp. RUD330]|uniref:hypothetical protein n=1 Tax=Paenibacillus sp. RUD330 TaxID=2023772 RepID=UPI001115A617|nr:hypothetical protein [Paenibacillus sp. RUD330]QID16073.1 hypothetical protein CIC07_25435 [Paenibacillus sp. RUD330]
MKNKVNGFSAQMAASTAEAPGWTDLPAYSAAPTARLFSCSRRRDFIPDRLGSYSAACNKLKQTQKPLLRRQKR